MLFCIPQSPAPDSTGCWQYGVPPWHFVSPSGSCAPSSTPPFGKDLFIALYPLV